ncbi:hypothetical protein [Streptomyces sp. URMC 125]|uniref:hypothetical protein n=1 Tax=Streptomyces sp. URMC 125 TaxID=3423419 RepID=UPI003F1D9151
MPAECNGRCTDCPYDFCAPATTRARPTKAEERRGWKQDALFELEELGDLYGVDPGVVRL